MSQSLMTQDGLTAAFAPESEEVWLVFIQISHSMITDGPMRFVRNTEDITRNGQLYMGIMFDITLPGQHERQAAIARISLPNVDRRITDSLRPLTGTSEAIEVEISVALASSPNDTQHGPWLTGLRNVTWDAQAVQADLIPVIDLDQSWPNMIMDNARFPGLFPG